MIFAAALVALYIAAFAFGAVDATLADALLPVLECGLCLAALAIPAARRALLDTLTRYWPAALAYTLFVLLMAWEAGLLGGAPHGEPLVTHSAVFRLIGFAFGALGMAGVALASGRRTMQNALLVGAIALGGLAIAQHLQAGRTLFDAPGETASVFALFAAMAAFAIVDATGTQRAPQPMERRRTRAERLLLPVAGFVASLIGLALTGSIEIIAGLGLGLAALALSLALRERQRGAGLLLLSGAAAICAIGGGTLIYLSHRASGDNSILPAFASNGALHWPLIGAALVWIVMLARLALSNDRRRRPSRGLGLALAGLAVMALAGPSASMPAAFATLALLVGLSAAYADWLAALNPEQRSSGQT